VQEFFATLLWQAATAVVESDAFKVWLHHALDPLLSIFI
jgi:hypothetical protein